jgi:drug/metabolite transporter (DMT)-like permease
VSEPVLAATLLALGAAVLHAGWNLWVKQSGDRWIALWGQMFSAGVGGLVISLAVGIPHGFVWWPAVASGVIHLYYIVALARSYDLADFSVTYPIARGSGALLAAVGGVLFLDDHLSLLMVLGILVAVGGIVLLAGHADTAHARAALIVGAFIATYSLVDSHGSRANEGHLYALLIFTTTGLFTTLHGLAAGKKDEMIAAYRLQWRQFAVAGAASALTYWMVMIAVRSAPVGYVTALRESSVVIVALVGTRYLGEEGMRRRVTAAAIVVAGLVVLVAGR